MCGSSLAMDLFAASSGDHGTTNLVANDLRSLSRVGVRRPD
jgi:hypothetical protein